MPRPLAENHGDKTMTKFEQWFKAQFGKLPNDKKRMAATTA